MTNKMDTEKFIQLVLLIMAFICLIIILPELIPTIIDIISSFL